MKTVKSSGSKKVKVVKKICKPNKKCKTTKKVVKIDYDTVLEKKHLLPPALQNHGIKAHPTLKQYLSAPKTIFISPRPGVSI